MKRDTKNRNILPSGYDKLNPLRQPMLVADARPYWGTIAILVYLTRKYGGTGWLPDDAAAR